MPLPRFQRPSRHWPLCFGINVLVIAALGCGAPRLAYYPATTPEPMHTGDGKPLTAQVVRQGAPVLAAPRAGALPLATLGFADTLLLYAFQPARQGSASPQFALVGPPGDAGTVLGWVPAGDLWPGDKAPQGRLVLRTGPDTPFRAGPGPGFPAVDDAEHGFLAVRYAARDGYLLVGPLQAANPVPGAPEIAGWLPQDATVPWDGALGARFYKENFARRPPAQVLSATGNTVLYAEPASAAALAPGANRFPVLGQAPDEPGPLQVALPGGAVGQVAEFNPAGDRQVQVERLLSRAQVGAAGRLFRRVIGRARSDPRALAGGRSSPIPGARDTGPSLAGGRSSPIPGARDTGPSLAGAVATATGTPTTSLASHCAATLGFPLHTPPLGLTPEALVTFCMRDPDGCARALAALRRSIDALASVEEEIEVRLEGGEVKPVREHSWSKGPRPHPYWWRGGDGRELAWVPVEFLP